MTHISQKHTPDQPIVPGADVIYRPAGNAGEYAPLATNPYVGCGHKCAYCLHPDTPIQMADGSARRIADVQIGDELIGLQKRDEVRRSWNYKFVASKVLNKIETVNQPVYRVTLNNGASVICSGSHRWLTERGWKFTSMLTLNNEVRTLSGPTQPTSEATGSYRRGYLAGMIRGDGTLKRYDYSGRYIRTGRGTPQNTDVQHHFRLALADSDALDRATEYLSSIGIETNRFEFADAAGARRPMQAIRNHSEEAFGKLSDLVRNDLPNDPEWLRGWLAGIFDAEGSTASGTLRVHNTDAAILDLTERAFSSLGFRTVRDAVRDNGCQSIRLLGGLPEAVRFFNLTGPAIARKFPIIDQRLRGSSKVVSVNRIMQRVDLIDITTSTENFIANGMISHNCYVPNAMHLQRSEFNKPAKLRDGYLARLEVDARRHGAAGLDDMQRQIFITFSSDPWHPGDHSPTRKVLDLLVDHGLAFCTLTKSGSAAVRNGDIGWFRPKHDAFAATMTSLDDDFSRKWEPDAALPDDRMAGLKAFHERGIFTWVSIEPTLSIEHSLAVIEATAGFVDLYKIGRANYLQKITRETDWSGYTLRVIELLQKLGKPHYVKRDLQAYLPPGYHNPLRVAQHH